MKLIRSNPRERLFLKQLPAWYRKNGRHDLPWRKTRDPYRILVAEVMLQQTQVSRVLNYYRTFLKKFPTARSLARAPLGEVLAAWSGLGYNRRAKYLQEAALIAVREWGKIPRDTQTLESLPGVGHYTARAVACFSGGPCEPFLETNIRRVILHFFFPRSRNVSDKKLLATLKKISGEQMRMTQEQRERVTRSGAPSSAQGFTNPSTDGVAQRQDPFVKTRSTVFSAHDFYLSLMDYGAMELRSVPNPNRRSKHYARQGKFEGSNRQVRGQIIRLLLRERNMRVIDIVNEITPSRSRPLAIPVLRSLLREGMIRCALPLTETSYCDIVRSR